MKSNFYFVRTPLQYLNALEARNTDNFQSDEHHLIVLSDFHRTLSQIESILEYDFWKSVQFPWKEFSKSKNNPLFNALNVFNRKLKLDKILYSIKHDDLIFWGNIHTNWFFYLFRKTKSAIYILDDGFVTINTIKKTDLDSIKTTLLSSKIGKIERFILKLNFDLKWDRITFYTNFNLKESEKKNYLHDYSYLSKQFKEGNKTRSIFFIGQPLIFQKMMKKEVYISLIDSIFSFYQSRNFTCYYISHRSTTLDYIPSHWLTKSFNKPIECILFDEQIEKPEIFVSFYSSALYNMAMMDKNSVYKYDYWQFDESDLLNFPFEAIQEVFGFIQSQPKTKITIRHKSAVND